MTRPINIELSGKFLNFAIEALDFRIKAYKKDLANPHISEDEQADISNDLMVLESLLEEWQQEEKEQKLFNTREILPTAFPKVVAIQKDWNKEMQLIFCEKMAFATTICVRDIWGEEAISISDKLQAMAYFNEFQHFILGKIIQLSTQPFDDSCQTLVEDSVFFLNKNTLLLGYAEYIVVQSFEKTKGLSLQKWVTPLEYFMLNQALNEVTGGPEAIPDWEFNTRMGVTKEEAISVLRCIDRDYIRREIK
jgi:hypothetical protein